MYRKLIYYLTWSNIDLWLQSTGSFFQDRSITLGSLIGITSIFELSSRSLKRSRKQDTSRGKKSQKNNTWFSCFTRAQLKSVVAGNAPSLDHFLEVERRASHAHRRNRRPITYELVGLHENGSNAEANSLFANGLTVPPQVDGNGALVLVGDVKKSNSTRSLCHDDGCCLALMFPCLGGRSGHWRFECGHRLAMFHSVMFYNLSLSFQFHVLG